MPNERPVPRQWIRRALLAAYAVTAAARGTYLVDVGHKAM